MAYHKWSSFIQKVHPTYPLKQQFFKILFLVLRAASGGVAAGRGTGRAGPSGIGPGDGLVPDYSATCVGGRL